MAAYEYTALDAGGRELRGLLEGDSARQVRQLLRDQSLLPVTVAEVSDKEAPRALSFSFGSRITHPTAAEVQQIHDALCQANSTLPLA